MSETMLAFARPLLDVFPDPPTTEELSQIMTFTTVAWNLPLYELRKHRQAAAHRAVFDQMQAQMPPHVAKVLAAMLYARLTTYAHDPRTGFAEVVEGEHGQAQVLATAALTDDWEGTARGSPS